MKEVTIGDIKIKYNEHNIKILNSYKIKDKYLMRFILNDFLAITKFKSKRSVNSWIREWKSHNRLYKLGLFKSHTTDCDLEENEKKHRLLAYWFLGI